VADSAEFLLEIGFEEMPAAWLPALTAQLRERFLEAAERERLEPVEVLALSTPRRLVLRAHVRRKQDDREESVWGPALKAAKDASGLWTGAAQGFARKNGVAPEALGVGAKDAGKPDEKSLLFVKKVEGRESGAVLASLLPALLRGLAKQSAGLCLITTREPLADLGKKSGIVERDLEQITPQAGRALLRALHVAGTDAELESLARRFGPHARAVGQFVQLRLHRQGPVARQAPPP
jgi:hypothetical protein